MPTIFPVRQQHRVLKYHIPLADSVSLHLVTGSEILSFQAESDKMYIWVLSPEDPEHAITEVRTFRIYGTDRLLWRSAGDAYRGLHYIGTMKSNGVFIWHLFEEINKDGHVECDT